MDVGSYLRSARERQRLSLAELSRHTKINCELLVDLENNDLSRWPRHRVYRHGHLRSYAEALGLDPKKVLKQFDDEFGDPYPAAFHGRPRTSFRDLPPMVRSGFLPASFIMLIGGALAVFDVSNNNVTARQPSSPQIQYHLQEAVQSVADRAVPPIEVVEPIASDIDGELRIVSTPAGAHVTVNGIARGRRLCACATCRSARTRFESFSQATKSRRRWSRCDPRSRIERCESSCAMSRCLPARHILSLIDPRAAAHRRAHRRRARSSGAPSRGRDYRRAWCRQDDAHSAGACRRRPGDSSAAQASGRACRRQAHCRRARLDDRARNRMAHPI